ncbi:MAG: glycosyltransferase family 4 protein [Desulfovibrio sp.]|nr:glycosyltransferase family 4 protein [Desulfovibrio sp.]
MINTISLLGEESGIGTYTRQIASGCQTDNIELTLFYGYPSKKLIRPADGQYGSWLGSLKGLAKKISFGRKICIKVLHGVNVLANALFPQSWDCYFEPNFVLLPTLHAERKVITAHDFSCFRYPQWHPVERVRYMEKFFWRSVAQADHVITPSETIRQEGINMFGIDPGRITAIPNGVDHSHFYPRSVSVQQELRKRYGLPPQFILYVGALEPRKNLANLIHAHAALPEALRRAYPLLLIGSQGWNNEEIMRLIRLNASYTRLLGYVPRSDLPAFYSAASLFAYPSWYEGFGLPALEAMACGRAVLTSQASALVEFSAGAALHARADDINDMALKMRELLENTQLRNQLEQKAPELAARYSWTRSAQKHLDVFKSLA